jgi:hypothetical protein
VLAEPATIRAVVQAYADGKIELEPQTVRIGERPTGADRSPKPYNASTAANVLGWLNEEKPRGACPVAFGLGIALTFFSYCGL